MSLLALDKELNQLKAFPDLHSQEAVREWTVHTKAFVKRHFGEAVQFATIPVYLMPSKIAMQCTALYGAMSQCLVGTAHRRRQERMDK